MSRCLFARARRPLSGVESRLLLRLRLRRAGRRRVLLLLERERRSGSDVDGDRDDLRLITGDLLRDVEYLRRFGEGESRSDEGDRLRGR